MLLTTNQLADKEGVKVSTVHQSYWLKKEFRGYKPVAFQNKQGVGNRAYMWSKTDEQTT
jgi:hypothetical protein